jgi:hypothetical protein
MKNFTIINKWIDYHYNLNNKLLSSIQINLSINDLFKNFIELSQNTFISIQFKIEFNNNQYRSVSFLQTVKLTEKEDLIENFIEFWDIRDQDYISLNPSIIIYTYKLISENNGIIVTSRLNRSKSIILEKESKDSFIFKGYNLPSTMDFTTWGQVLFTSNNFAQVKKYNSNSIYHIVIYDKELKVTLKNKDHTLLEFIDRPIENGKLSSFIRTLRNHEYIFIDNKCVLKKIKRENKFLTPIIGYASLSNKFITMDLETRAIDGIMTAYAACIYDGQNKTSFYLEDYLNSDQMLVTAIESLLRKKYNQYKVYIHNFSNFDSIFMLRVLSNMKLIIRPIIRDGRMIELKISWKKYSVYFRDSYLLLPSSLKKLAINFDVSIKGIFPYEFVNKKEIPLSYRGPVPAREFYKNLSREEYNSIIKNTSPMDTWDLREETIKYCEQDVITLYQVISKFSEQIFILFRTDIVKYPTLPSLAFAIYRNKFIGDARIPLIHGAIYEFLVKGYTGGSVDVYKSKGENIYRYDVNSLYPFVMRNYPMPVGNITYFEGDINKINPKSFGIFEVEVTSPKEINIPLLQTRIKTNSVSKTVSPLGNWTGVYFSEEIYNAMAHGYTFKIIRGYTFDRGYIFKDYVDFLYDLKVNSPKGTPDYIIAKLLLNSLYGRFGMNPHCENHLIINSKDFLEFQNNNIITNVVDLKNGRELISFFEENEWNEAESKKSLNISVVISSAVTSSARIHMSQFKAMRDITLYYTDTDSIDIDKALPDKYVGRELGLMKLEHIFDEAIFLAPKVYGGITNEYELVRVKGLKNHISFEELKPLLQTDSHLEIHQEKWYKNVSNGHINIKNEIYNLSITANKRTLIYNSKNILYNTKPLRIKNGTIQE